MSTRLMARLGAGSGIAYVGLIVIAGQLGPAAGIPATSASQHTIGSYIAHHPPSTAQWAGVYLEVLALLAFVVFVGYLWHVLRDAERDTGWMAGVAPWRRTAQRGDQAREPARRAGWPVPRR